MATITQDLGKVAYLSKGAYSSSTQYEKNDVVTYEGSSYVSLQATQGNAPTNTTYWQLIAEKGTKGDTGATGATGASNELTIGTVSSGASASATITGTSPNQVLNLVLPKGDKGDQGMPGEPSGTPLVASSISGMTDTSRVYINTTDGHWYYYDGTTWQDGGVYQSTGIEENSVGIMELSTDFKSSTSNLLDISKALPNKRYTTNPLPTSINDITTFDDTNGWIAYPIIEVVPGGQYRPLDSDGNPKPANTVLYFDQNGDFVSQTGIGQDADFTIPNNVYYLCFGARSSYNITQFKRTDVQNFISEYEPYKYKSNIVLQDDIENMKGFYELNFVWTDNSYVSKVDGLPHTDQWSSSYSSSNFVSVICNHTLKLENILATGNIAIIGYDKNKNMVDIMDTSSSNKIYEYNIPEEVRYIKVTTYTTNKNNVKGYYTDAKFSDGDNRINLIENRLDISLENLLIKTNSNAILTWVDDDTDINSIPTVKSLCDDLNIKCTFGCITKRLETVNGLLQLLKNYQLDGFHITSHTHTHDRWYKEVGGEAKFTEIECINDLIKSMEVLTANGFFDNKLIISPGSAVNRTDIDAVDIMKKYADGYIIGNADASYNDVLEPSNYRLNRTFVNTSVHNLQYYKDMLDTALENKNWIILGSHSYDNSQWNSTFMRDILVYAQSIGIEILPLNQALKKRRLNYDIAKLFEE